MRTRRTLLASGVAGLVGLAGCTAMSPSSGDGSGGTTETDSADTTESGSTRIGFVGDLMLGRSVNERWADADDGPEEVWGSTRSRLQELDGLVGNLECCVSDRGTRWPDKGYYFRSDPGFAVPALEAAGASFVSLANNHILDFRESALRATRAHLADAGIARAGAGTDRRAAAPRFALAAGGGAAFVVVLDRYSAGIEY